MRERKTRVREVQKSWRRYKQAAVRRPYSLRLLLLVVMIVLVNLLLLFAATCCSGVFSSSSSSSASAPWYDDAVRSVKDTQHYQDKPHIIFAPSGRLVVLEEAMQAVGKDDCSSNTVIAIHCATGVVVVSSLLVSPYMIMYQQEDDESDETTKDNNKEHEKENEELDSLLLTEEEIGLSPTLSAPFARLLLASDSPVLAVTAGNAIESQVLRQLLMEIAERVRANTGGDDPHFVDTVARQLADQQQLRTQSFRKGRTTILACSAILCSKNTLWRVDCTGQFWKCQAVVAGRNAVAAEQGLLAKLKKSSDDNEDLSPKQLRQRLSELSVDQAIAVASECIRDAIQKKSDKMLKKSSPQIVRLRAVSIDAAGRVRCYSPRELSQNLVSTTS